MKRLEEWLQEVPGRAVLRIKHDSHAPSPSWKWLVTIVSENRYAYLGRGNNLNSAFFDAITVAQSQFSKETPL